MARTFKKEDTVVRFQHTENGKIVRLLETADNGTVLVEFEADGKTTNYSPSTWKRYWRKLEDDTVVDVKEETPVEQFEAATEEVAGDGTPYSQVLKEIQEDAKKTAEKAVAEKKAKKSKRITKPTFDSAELQEYCVQLVEELGGSFTVRKLKNGSDMKSKVFKDSLGHMFAHMHYSKYQVYVDTRGLDEVKFPGDKKLTGFYEVRFYFNEDNKKVRDTLKKILTQGFNAQISRRTKKEDK